MLYKGEGYRYAFEFTVPIEINVNRKFRIAISNFREFTQDFSGLCFDNGLMVVSPKQILFEAFFDIITTIVNITLQGEKAFAQAHSGQCPVPFMQVIDPEVLYQFEEHRKFGKSLEDYMKLRKFLENPEKIPDNLSLEEKCDICDCPTMLLFSYLLHTADPPIKDVNFFRI
jgi:hypothetical protein